MSLEENNMRRQALSKNNKQKDALSNMMPKTYYEAPSYIENIRSLIPLAMSKGMLLSKHNIPFCYGNILHFNQTN
jgi:hypothetical protein